VTLSYHVIDSVRQTMIHQLRSPLCINRDTDNSQ